MQSFSQTSPFLLRRSSVKLMKSFKKLNYTESNTEHEPLEENRIYYNME